MREPDEHLGFGDLIAQNLTDPQRGENTQPLVADLLHQPVSRCIAGYEDLNDAERLCQDPASRRIGSERIWERGVALTPRLESFETGLLCRASVAWGCRLRATTGRPWAASNNLQSSKYMRKGDHGKCQKLSNWA